MKENGGKAQVTGATGREVDKLKAELQRRGLPEDLLVGPLEVLGGATRGCGQGVQYTDRETSRLAQATCVAATVAALPVARHTKRRYQQVFAMSKANYGRVAKAPTRALKGSLNAAIRRTRHNHASKHLTNLVDADLDLKTTTAVETVSVLCRRLARGKVAWDSARKNTHAAHVRKTLNEMGWQETPNQQFAWIRTDCAMQLDLEAEKTTGKDWIASVAHRIREGARRTHFKAHTTSKRHEVHEMATIAYDEELVTRMRRMDTNETARDLLVGPIASPATYAKTRTKQNSRASTRQRQQQQQSSSSKSSDGGDRATKNSATTTKRQQKKALGAAQQILFGTTSSGHVRDEQLQRQQLRKNSRRGQPTRYSAGMDGLRQDKIK